MLVASIVLTIMRTLVRYVGSDMHQAQVERESKKRLPVRE